MAGKGPRPKEIQNLASRSRLKARADGMRVFTAAPAEQPPLPDCIDWPAITQSWWATWGAEPMAADFRPTDWDFLLDTALLHAKVWGEGDTKLLAELRLRVAKMGATSEDRARLRITYAQADEAEEKRDRKGTPVSRYKQLRAVD
jgi:hypothetical protein